MVIWIARHRLGHQTPPPPLARTRAAHSMLQSAPVSITSSVDSANDRSGSDRCRSFVLNHLVLPVNVQQKRLAHASWVRIALATMVIAPLLTVVSLALPVSVHEAGATETPSQAGQSWFRDDQMPAGTSLNSVSCVPDETPSSTVCVAVGTSTSSGNSYGQALWSSDGGVTWTARRPLPSQRKASIC